MTAPRPTRRPDDGLGLVHLRELPKVAAALAVLAGCTLVAREGVPDWEAGLFVRINQLSDDLEAVLWAPMQLGSLVGPILAAVVAWWGWQRWRPAVGSLVVGGTAWQGAKGVKDAVARGRPTALADEVVRRWGTPGDGLGFVSGHSAVAFGLAGVLSPYLGRRWRWAAYGAAGLVALARIHLAAHYPLDTVGGAALGLGLAHLYGAAVGVPRDTSALIPPRVTSDHATGDGRDGRGG